MKIFPAKDIWFFIIFFRNGNLYQTLILPILNKYNNWFKLNDSLPRDSDWVTGFMTARVK